jgi:hypothetical protein
MIVSLRNYQLKCYVTQGSRSCLHMSQQLLNSVSPEDQRLLAPKVIGKVLEDSSSLLFT